MNFKLGPFPCTNCGRVLLIDTVKVSEEDSVLDIEQFNVGIVLDHESMTYPEWWQKPEWDGMGRRELIHKIYDLRHQIKELEFKVTPWYKKPWYRPRRFI